MSKQVAWKQGNEIVACTTCRSFAVQINLRSMSLQKHSVVSF